MYQSKNMITRIVQIGVLLMLIGAAVIALNGEWEYSTFVSAEEAHGSLVGYFEPKSALSMNVVLISLDTLRADHLGCYGYPRPTSPNIDRLAANSMLFERAYATAPATAESHMSMFTGLPASVHKVWTIAENQPVRVLDRGIDTLPQVMSRNGYRTVGFHGGGHVAEHLGFGRGFDQYNETGIEAADQWVRSNADGDKFFLFFHTYRVHDPYTPSEQYATMYDPGYKGAIEHRKDLFQGEGNDDGVNQEYWSRVNKKDPADIRNLVALYDGELTELDADLGRFFRTIQDHAPNTLIVILSDHGELFGEYGRFRHGQLLPEVLHVPLIIHHPNQGAGVRVSDQVSLMSLTPSILKMLGLPDTPQFRDFRRKIPTPSGEELIFASFPGSGDLTVISGRDQLRWQGPVKRHLRWTGAFAGGSPNGACDPTGPCQGRAVEVPILLWSERRWLRNSLLAWQHLNSLAEEAYSHSEAREEMTPEMLKRLKSLGYIQ